MKHAVTFRLDPDLLAAARQCATQENRTLTNFVETVIKQHLSKTLAKSEPPLTATNETSRPAGRRAVGPAASEVGRSGE